VAVVNTEPVDPLVLQAGEGETITHELGRFVQIKASHELLALTDNRYGPGESGPEPHVHLEHADSFFVLGGELSFELGGEGEPLRAGAGAFVMVPPGVVHTFRNSGPADADFLNLHAPSKRFADHLRAGGDAADLDTFDPPADGGRPASDAVLRRAGEGEVLELGPSTVTIKAGGGDGIGSVAACENTVAAGFPGPIPHRHARMVDAFWVLAGTLTVLAGDATVELREGGFALMPPGARHTFSNPGDLPVRVLNVFAPGGFEGYLREFAVVAARDPGSLPDPETMARLAAKYDFEPLP
jgi:mannose-6-phosphate isomerase-like protein (cupin superfamily)